MATTAAGGSPLVAGIDVGTTNTKAVLYSLELGRVVGVSSRPTTMHHPRPTRSEFDAEELWQGVAWCLRDVLERCGRPPVAGIAVASMAEAGVPLDAAGQPVYPVIAWYDERTAAQRDRWEQVVGAERSYRLSGQMMRHTFGAHKLVWLRENEPGVFAGITRWVGVADWIAYRLCGVAATDYTLAARTLLFEPGAAGWSDTLLGFAGLDRSLLPPVLPSGTRIGEVTAEAAAVTGLSRGAVVATGGHDHLCGALAAGVIEPGSLLDSTGTAEGVVVVSPTYTATGEGRRSGVACYHHVVADRYVLIGGLAQAGGLVRWILDCFPPAHRGEGTAPARDAFLEAAGVPRGAGGLLCLPHLLGTGIPAPDPYSRAAFVGLRPHHTPAHLLRAVLEALGHWLAQAVEVMELLQEGTGFAEIVGIGGATSFPLWMQIKADVTGRRVRVPALDEAVALGAALLAAPAAGLARTAAEAQSTLRVPASTYEPDTEAHAFYAGLPRDLYRLLQETLREINHALDGFA